MVSPPQRPSARSSGSTTTGRTRRLGLVAATLVAMAVALGGAAEARPRAPGSTRGPGWRARSRRGGAGAGGRCRGLGLGLGAPIRVYPEPRVGVRTQLTLHWLGPFALVGTFDAYPIKGAADDYRGAVMIQVGL